MKDNNTHKKIKKLMNNGNIIGPDGVLTKDEITSLVNHFSISREYNDIIQSNEISDIKRDFIKHEELRSFLQKNGLKFISKQPTDSLAKKSHSHDIPFTYDLNAEENVIGRESELFALNVLTNKKIRSNVLLTGPAGVGKTTLVAKLSEKKNIVGLNTLGLTEGTAYRGSFEKRANEVLDGVMSNNLILFIDEIHSIYSLGKSEGGLSLMDILKPYLSSGKLRIIGATTNEELKILKNDRAFMRRFSLLNIKPLPKKSIESNVRLISEDIRKKHYKVHIENKELNKLLDFVEEQPNQERLVDLFRDQLDLLLAIAEEENIIQIDNEKFLYILNILKSIY